MSHFDLQSPRLLCDPDSNRDCEINFFYTEDHRAATEDHRENSLLTTFTYKNFHDLSTPLFFRDYLWYFYTKGQIEFLYRYCLEI